MFLSSSQIHNQTVKKRRENAQSLTKLPETINMISEDQLFVIQVKSPGSLELGLYKFTGTEA